MLTALEALMYGRHSVGCLLPEVQKCCLKQQDKQRPHIQPVTVKVIHISSFNSRVSSRGLTVKSPCSVFVPFTFVFLLGLTTCGRTNENTLWSVCKQLEFVVYLVYG